MAALDRINLLAVRSENIAVAPEVIRAIAGKAIWDWFREHQDEEVFKFGIGKFAITRKVRHLRFLIQRIAGPER